MVRKWLQLTRAHTAPLESVPAWIGAAMATGDIWSVTSLLWASFGLMYHLTGYGYNSYSDWRNGHDKGDKYKRHHPLNTGELSPGGARNAIIIMAVITALIPPVLSGFDPKVIMAEGVMVMFGSLYNEMGKETPFKFIYISIAHSFVFIIPYLSVVGRVDTIGAIMMAYVFLWVAFQISVSGEVKDFTQPEQNFLKLLGSGISAGGVYFSDRARRYTFALKGLQVIIGTIGVYMLSESVSYSAAYFLLSGLYGIGPAHDLVSSGPFNRYSRIRYMSIVEAFSLLGFILIAAPLIGWDAVVLFIGSMIWLVTMNYIEWGTLLSPKV